MKNKDVSQKIKAMPPRYISAIDSRGTGGARAPPEFGEFSKGAKPDFCLSEFSYYYEHPRI